MKVATKYTWQYEIKFNVVLVYVTRASSDKNIMKQWFIRKILKKYLYCTSTYTNVPAAKSNHIALYYKH